MKVLTSGTLQVLGVVGRVGAGVSGVITGAGVGAGLTEGRTTVGKSVGAGVVGRVGANVPVKSKVKVMDVVRAGLPVIFAVEVMV